MKQGLLRMGLAVALGLCMFGAGAEVTLPALFSDGMVLQRNAPVKVWGWAKDGEQVTVAVNTQVAEATAKNGKWELNLGAMGAGGPYTLVVKGENTITIDDVLVGEVWVCGGQSNMQWGVSNSTNPEVTIAAANHPNIRLFKVPVKASDEPLYDVDAQWVACSPSNVGGFTAVGYNFGVFLQEHLDVPIGLIQSCLGGTNVSSWVPRYVMKNNLQFSHFVDDWDAEMERYPEAKAAYDEALAAHNEKIAAAEAAGEELSPQERRAPQAPRGANDVKRPGGLYNAMMIPLQPYTIQGAIWYQGESNAGNPASSKEYRRFFPAMIEKWRMDWGQGNFPFLFVQLAGFGSWDSESWCLLQEAQTMTLSMPNTGMASAIDIGAENDIHPRDKYTVGKRLADTALAVAYGKGGAISGPILDTMYVQGNQAIVNVDRTQGGLVVRGDAPEGFEIAGADGKYVTAQASVKGNTVTVWSPEVSVPVHVRYAWKDFGPCNVYSAEGRPLVPFRTDK